MRKYKFQLDEKLVNVFFKPVRSKKDIILLLMKSIKLMLVNKDINLKTNCGSLTLAVSKISRLIYVTEDKIFSICFPFTVTETSNGIEFNSKSIKRIDNKVTSDVISIISKENLMEIDCAIDFIDPILEINDEKNIFWPFILQLLTFEDGYIRYDYDTKNQNKDLHPINHYDIFYTSSSTFKIGLRNKINEDELLKLIDPKEICRYLEPSNKNKV